MGVDDASQDNKTGDDDKGATARQTQPPSDGLGAGWAFWRRRRRLLSLLAFLGFFNVYSLRVNLSVAIVAMTAERNVTLANGTLSTSREFEWSPGTQGLVLGAFFWGYVVTQIPGGWLAARVGGARLYGAGIAATAALTLLTPPLARLSVYLLLALRIIEGLLEGVTHPAINHVWSRWAPPHERSRLATFALSGSYFGTFVSLPVSGVIASNLGWEAVFYICGAIAVLWYVVWFMCIAEDPLEDKRITSQELEFIQSCLGEDRKTENVQIPWLKFLTSPPVWAVLFAHFTENWGFYTLLTQLPTYMKDVHHFSLEESGGLSAVPYIIMAALLQFSGHLADLLQNRNILSHTQVRKIFICGAFVIETVAMVLASYASSISAIMACLTISVAVGAFSWAGICVNHLDMAPQYAGVLMGLSQTVATIPGMVSPPLTGFIVKNKDPEEWRTVFFITSGVYLLGTLVYGVFGSAERQSWARGAAKKEEMAFDNKAIETETTSSL
ncbi:vesicular glutamate transporter 2-like [Schistocerca piceifrons]|uniref:vesicular glutamate transporter 2-like n=1 Tax=Schistocerca piceifrons TaxID=274613 RepID=UPI001F5EDF1A|nr:vesicular glutamate transporter 2-like [Schistocerca piceifrons]